jgi:hypothetical protein
VYGGWGASGSTILLDAWIEKDLGNGWSIQAGQFKLPNWWEWKNSETRLQFVERSVLDARYASVYAQGVQLHFATDEFRAHVAFSDGLRTLNTPFGVGPSAGGSPRDFVSASTDYAFTARGEYKLQGNWKHYADHTSFPDEDPLYVIGGTVHFQDSESGTAAAEYETLQWTIDGTFEFGGANIFAAVIGTHVEDSTGAVDRDEFGFLIQGGYFITDDWELIARYEYGDMDGGEASATADQLSIVTIGATRYWNKHGLKWTTDLGFALDEVDANWGAAGRGFRTDAAGEDGQMVIRSQVQLLF